MFCCAYTLVSQRLSCSDCESERERIYLCEWVFCKHMQTVILGFVHVLAVHAHGTQLAIDWMGANVRKTEADY